MCACRLCSLKGIKEREGATGTLLRNRGLQRGDDITRLGVVRDLLRGSALLLLVGDHLHRIRIHDERSKRAEIQTKPIPVKWNVVCYKVNTAQTSGMNSTI